MADYSVRGFTGATLATATHAICTIWNPSSTRRIKVWEIGSYRGGTNANYLRAVIVTARGTPGSTVTPDADNDWSGDGDVPPSGVLLDLAPYSVQPTLTDSRQAIQVPGGTGSAGVGAVFLWPDGWDIMPGKGLAVIQGSGVVYPASELYCVWGEG